MIEPKQIQRAAEAFVLEVSVGMRDVVARLPGVDGRNLRGDVATEAFDLVTALIDVDRSHTDNELWGLIFAFGTWMPGQLGRAKPDELRRSNLLVGRAAWLEQVSPMFEVLVTADRKFGTTHSRNYYDRALHLAFTVAALDAAPSRSELQAIDALRSRLLVAMDGLSASPLTPGPAGTGATPPTAGAPGEPGAAAVAAQEDVGDDGDGEPEALPRRAP